jgi:hypothetical protein
MLSCPARLPGESTLASGATIHTFEVELSDVDRGVYEALSLRVVLSAMAVLGGIALVLGSRQRAGS